MDTEGKQQQKSEDESTDIHLTEMTPSAFFLPHDVILEVEGMKLYVRKEVLADNSPVFKRMLKSDFKEKRQIEIPLPGKKFREFEEFLRSFYHLDIKCPITDDTVLGILSLADEYQVSEVINGCENVIIGSIKKTLNHETEQIDLQTLLKYVSSAELYNLSLALPLALQSCAKYTEDALPGAMVQNPVSDKMLAEIYKERIKLMETLTKEKIEKGEYENILGTLDSLSGMNGEDKNDLMRKYETRLINACSSEKISTENLLDIIIAAETLKLEMVCTTAIDLGTRCKSRSLKESKKYKKISRVTRNKIDEKRIFLLEKNGTRLDVKFSNVNPDY